MITVKIRLAETGESVHSDLWILYYIDQFNLLIIKTFLWSISSGKWWSI